MSDTTNQFSETPYPGLRPFRRDEGDIFFGREEQIDQLLTRLEDCRFLSVVGVSGCGKSSLVRAGMLSALEGGFMASAGARWQVAEMRPGSQPLGNLASGLLNAEVLSPEWAAAARNPLAFAAAVLRRGPLGLIELLRESPLKPRHNLLLLVDQFEELFRFHTHGDRNEASAFVELLLHSARQSEVPVYVVITMRSDFLGDGALFPGLAEAINDGQFLIPRLNREQCRAAIMGPAAAFGGELEPALVSRVLNDVGSDPDYLPLMQHALMRMWNRVTADQAADEDEFHEVLLTLDEYEAVGGLKLALSNHANESYAALTEAQQRIAMVMFRCLSERGTDQRDTRRPTPLSEVSSVAGASLADVIEVVDVFRDPERSFLMPPAPAPIAPETVLDISHESLIRQWDRMRDWVQEEAESAAMYRRLSETAALWEADQAALWVTPDLENAQRWCTQQRPTVDWAHRYGGSFLGSMNFLDASVRARDEQQQAETDRRQRELSLLQNMAETERQRADEQAEASTNMRRRALVAGGAGVIALVLAVVSLVMYFTASSARDRAEISQVEAELSRKQAVQSATRADVAREQAEVAKQQTDEALREAETARGRAEAVEQDAIAKTLDAWMSLGEAKIVQSDVLKTAREAGRQIKALKLFGELMKLRNESSQLAAQLKDSEQQTKNRAKWNELVPRARERAVGWMSETSLQRTYTTSILNRYAPAIRSAMSPDGRRLVTFRPTTTAYAGSLILTDTSNGTELARYTLGRLPQAPALLEFADDSELIMVSLNTSYRKVYVERFDASKLARRSRAEFPFAPSAPPSLSPVARWSLLPSQDQLVYSGIGDGNGCIWDLKSNGKTRVLPGRVTSIAQAGGWAISIANRDAVNRLNLSDKKSESIVTVKGDVTGATPTPDGRFVLVEKRQTRATFGVYNKFLALVDVESGETISEVTLPIRSRTANSIYQTFQVAFHPSQPIVVLDYGAGLAMLSLPDLAVIARRELSPKMVPDGKVIQSVRAQFSEDGGLLLTQSYWSGSVQAGPNGAACHFWDVSYRSIESRASRTRGGVQSFAMSGDRVAFAVTGGIVGGEVQLERRDSKPVWISQRPSHSSSNFNSTGERFIFVTRRDFTIYDADSGKALKTYQRQHPALNAVVLPIDQKSPYYVAFEEQTEVPVIRVVDAESLAAGFALPAVINSSIAIVFSDDRSMIAVRPDPAKRPKGSPQTELEVFRCADGRRLYSRKKLPNNSFFDIRFCGHHLIIRATEAGTNVLRAIDLESGNVASRVDDTSISNLTTRFWVSEDNSAAVYTKYDSATRQHQPQIWHFAAGGSPESIGHIGNLPDRVVWVGDHVAISREEPSGTSGSPAQHVGELWDVRLSDSGPANDTKTAGSNTEAQQPRQRRLVRRTRTKTSPDFRPATATNRLFVSLTEPDAEERKTELWSVTTGEKLGSWNASLSYVAPGGMRAVLSDGQVADAELVETVMTVEGDYKAMSANGRFYVTAQNKTSTLWDLVERKRVAEMPGDWGAYFNTTNDQVATLNFETDNLEVRELTKGEIVAAIPVNHGNFNPDTTVTGLTLVTFSPDGQHLSMFAHHQFRLASIEDSRIHTGLPREGHAEKVSCVDISPDGEVLASASEDDTVCLWATEDGRFLGTLENDIDPMRQVKFNADELVATRDSNGDILVWRWSRDGNSGMVNAKVLWHFDAIRDDAMTFSPEGKQFVFADRNKIRIVDARTGELQRVFSPERTTQPITALEYSPDGLRLAWGTRDSRIGVWNLESGAASAVWDSGQGAISRLRFDPADGTLVSVGSDVRLWHADTGSMLLTLNRHTQRVREIRFDEGGRWLVSAGDDRVMIRTDMASLRQQLAKLNLGWSDATFAGLASKTQTRWVEDDVGKVKADELRRKYYAQGIRAQREKNWERVIESMTQVLEISDDEPPRFHRARAYNELEQWKDAAKDFRHLRETGREFPMEYYYECIAYLGGGELDEYRRVASLMFDKYAKSDSAITRLTLMNVLILLPDPLDEPVKLHPVLDLSTPQNISKAGPNIVAALYRDGEYQQAIDQAAKTNLKDHFELFEDVFCSMALSRLEQHDEAKARLEKFQRDLQEFINAGKTDADDRLELQVLLQEAQTLLASAPE